MIKSILRKILVVFTLFAFFASTVLPALSRPAIAAANTAARSYDTLRDYLRKYVHGSLKSRWKQLSAPITQAILEQSQKFRMDPMLIAAVIEQESRFVLTARGTHGEIGLMQIKPSTARWLSRLYSLPWKGKSTLFDPVQNIQLGTAYLAFLREQFAEKAPLYVTAYNSGAGSIQRALRRGRVPRQYFAGVMSHYDRHQIAFRRYASV